MRTLIGIFGDRETAERKMEEYFETEHPESGTTLGENLASGGGSYFEQFVQAELLEDQRAKEAESQREREEAQAAAEHRRRIQAEAERGATKPEEIWGQEEVKLAEDFLHYVVSIAKDPARPPGAVMMRSRYGHESNIYGYPIAYSKGRYEEDPEGPDVFLCLDGMLRQQIPYMKPDYVKRRYNFKREGLIYGTSFHVTDEEYEPGIHDDAGGYTPGAFKGTVSYWSASNSSNLKEVLETHALKAHEASQDIS